jgi:hypothetical protein
MRAARNSHRAAPPATEDQTMRKTAIAMGMILLSLAAACSSPPEVASNEEAALCARAGYQPGTADYEKCLAAQRHRELRNFADLTIHGPAGH